MAEYITIAAFAVRAGVARQSVYPRLEKDLSGYCKTIDGKKMIDIEALSTYKRQDDCHYSVSVSDDCPENSQEKRQTVSQSVNQKDNSLTAYLKEELERSRQEINKKDELIASYADRFAALAEREQEISARALQTTGQAQLLHANTQDGKALLDQAEEKISAEGDAPKKKGLFARIFK